MKQLELSDLIKKEIQKMHSMEVQLADALKMLAKMASNPELKQGLEAHRQETLEHARRLKSISTRLGFPAVGIPCLATKAMATETLQDLNGADPSSVVDTLILGAGRKSEHLEIGAYVSLIALANRLGDSESADLMAQSLKEEKAADEKLAKMMEFAA